MHNPARLTCPMKQRRTTRDKPMNDLEKIAQKDHTKIDLDNPEKRLKSLKSIASQQFCEEYVQAKIINDIKTSVDQWAKEMSKFLSNETGMNIGYQQVVFWMHNMGLIASCLDSHNLFQEIWEENK